MIRFPILIAFLALVNFGSAAPVVVDPFTDGSHTNTSGGDPLGMIYFRTTTVATAPLTVADDTGGIGSGNALLFSPDAELQRIIANFPPITLGAAGESLSLTFDLRFNVAPSSGTVRLGLYYSNNTRQTSEPGGSLRNDDKGYGFTINPAATSNFNVLKEDTNGSDDILGGSVYFSSIGAVSGSTVALGTDKHTVSLKLTRFTNGDIEVRGQIDTRTPSVATVPSASVLTYVFDEFAFTTGNTVRGPYFLDNMSIVKSSPGAVTLDAPAPDTILSAPAALQLSATASDPDGVARVEFFDTGEKLGEAVAGPYDLSLVQPLPGIYSLTAVLVDGDGSRTSTPRVAVRVDGPSADEFDALRERWRTILAGGTTFNLSHPNVQSRVSAITTSAQNNWNSMVKSPGRTLLWSDLPSVTQSEQITTAYSRLRTMALALNTHGSSLQGNSVLRSDLISALDWMYANRYNETKTYYDNWFDWEIGAPLLLNDISVLIHESLTPTQIANYMAAIDKFTPTISPSPAPGIGAMTAANRVWKATVIAMRGVLLKKPAEVADARDGLSEVFDYVTAGDGFYVDGSFIQHDQSPYNGGYGTTLIGLMGPLLQLLDDSTWQVTDPDLTNVFDWIGKSFEPLVYRGAMMDMVRGRDIARMGGQDHGAGHLVIQHLLRLATLDSAQESANFKSMAKSWILEDTFRSFNTTANLPTLLLGLEVLEDTSIPAKSELIGHWTYGSMDRIVHRRPGFGFGISMNSTRIRRFESGSNGENLRGWFTSDGATWLYNDDLGQFTDFWPTVDHYRLPGTTVDKLPRIDSSGANLVGEFAWAGGATLAGQYGAAGMELGGYENSLTARKSWFMFDDEIVALGSAINSTDNRAIETIIENRKLKTAGDEVFTVEGAAQPATLGWSSTLSGTSWCHLDGVAGYYFPVEANVKALREVRNGSWSLVNNGNASPTSTTTITRNYLTLWFDHGSNPSDAGYAYTLLPGKTASETETYAGAPDIVVLENSAAAHGVREKRLNITSVNFWNDGPRTVGLITSNKKASVLARETAGQIDVAVSDPTQLNAGTIYVELDRSATGVMSSDAEIMIERLSPTIRFAADVSNLRGGTLKASFALPLAVVSVTAPDATAGEHGNNAASVRLARTGTGTSALTVGLIVGGSATGGADYTALPTLLVFAEGEMEKIFTVSPVADNLPEGNETLSVSLASGTDYIVGEDSGVTVTIMDAPIDTWRLIHFQSNPSQNGDLMDPDFDGLSNLLEYALGTEPNDQSQFDIEVGSEGSLSLTYNRSKLATDIDYLIEVSPDLASWEAATVTEEILSETSDVMRILATETTPLQGGTQRFIRLRVDR